MRYIRVLTGIVLGFAVLAATGARAADFTITTDTNAGTFTFTDTNPSDPVFEVVVSDFFPTAAGTTQPGFSASTIFFGSDPQNCLPVIGSTFTSGFCYNLTDPTAGQPITSGSTVFTYSSLDTPDPTEFAVAFDLPNGTVGACFGNTGPDGGCSAPVPEPASIVVLLSGLLALAGLLGLARTPRADQAS